MAPSNLPRVRPPGGLMNGYEQPVTPSAPPARLRAPHSRLGKLWFSIERFTLFQLIRLFRIRGQNEKVARGFSLGLVVNFFPTFGFGVLVSGFVARVLGGNAVAGIVGGALLTFAWPVLFYLNIRMGRLFVKPPIVVDEFEDVTEKTMDTLMWGHTFMAGAITNSILVGGMCYLVLRLLHWRIRPAALAYFRHHARDHQQRFRRRDKPQLKAC